MPPIRKLLIANRGEIARRIRRTCSAMGIKTAAVYTVAERDAPFVAESDEAVLLDGAGPGPYLDVAGLLDAARRTRADAVHPGYGFLAENASFAKAVVDAGLVWVGPPAEAIARMGDKLESKRVAREAGVPLLEPMDESAVELPALVKAAMGGGGKGMRVVRSRDELSGAIAAARREAEHAFGDGTLFIEPYLDKIRHVEVQVLGDGHGNLIHLGERECSIQRRHQKVIEESPSPAVDALLRSRMGEAALSLARAIGYRNAGTVEFLLADDGRFFFLEMNTRLQVEHPVTEEVYGVDLVEQQLLDASGERLGTEMSEPLGHAIEARLNSEDASNDFLPATGTMVGWAPDLELARVESGVEIGSVVGTSFDPLIAKFIGVGASRTEAAMSLALALERSTIQGVTTNRDVLVAILRSKEFLSGDTTTDFLDRVSVPTRRELGAEEREAVFASVVLAAQGGARSSARVLTTFPPGWRNSRMPPQRRILVLGEEETTVEYERSRDGTVHVDGRVVHLDDGVIEVDGRSVPVQLNRANEAWWVHGPWGDVEVNEKSPFPSSETEEASGSLHAPMPGSVVSVDVAVGDEVRKGQTLVVLEAMKMEHPIGSPEAGTVHDVKVAVGDQVERGALLVVVESPDAWKESPGMPALYDRIGRTYARYRRPDPHIARRIDEAIGDAASVLSIGSGTGSYEPSGRRVVAVEPSRVMIEQRPGGIAPVVQGVAEHLPVASGSFEVALAVQTIHHWTDHVAGLHEMTRIAERQVILTWDPSYWERFWLVADYIPEIPIADASVASFEAVTAVLDVDEVHTVPVPWNCTDGFCGAYWRRPDQYLDPGARTAISGFARCDPRIVAEAMRRLESDVSDGTWVARYGDLLELDELDLGYRLVVASGLR